ncbi:DNA ligase [[Clostridium] scindens]|uniref:DNA ligase (ATP) n=1 Tax=Clostridium scindens (strain JCM 10418 / VPI 12708) TaxID=29347 RepID=A0A844F302_CLOSV|nr:DNA ligase [[Clostridium] scindens]MSS38933.1 DNA ligase [[Clostridium] scindens]
MDIFDSKGIKPMLIAEQVDPYDDPDSIFELKVDGIRCIAYCNNTSVDLRNKRDIKLLPRFPELMNIYKSCQKKCILDGELNVLVNGKPDFYEVQKRTLLSDPFKIQLAYTKHPANFVAYDVLYYKDKLITDLPLIERKQILNNVVSENQLISVSRYVETSGKMLFELAKQQNLEGVVGKKKDSLYWFGKRTKDWNKIKVMADYEAIAIAYIPKPNNMTSLVLAKYNANNSLIITNHVTLGVSLSKLKQYGIKYSNCPFLEIPKGHENAVWIEPVVCTIEYMPSEKGGLRQAVFKGIRDDKLSEECRLDKIGE